MIMNGMPHMHIQQSGKKLCKLFIPIILAFSVLTGCSEGRGDWTKELCAGYAIDCVNSHEILLVYIEDPEQLSNSIVIKNYYIVAYWFNDQYIGLKGIQTQRIAASDEELKSENFSYYLIDAIDAEIIGPFETEATFIEHCMALGLKDTIKWQSTSENDGTYIVIT